MVTTKKQNYIKHLSKEGDILIILTEILKQFKNHYKWKTKNSLLFTDSKKKQIGELILHSSFVEIDGEKINKIWNTLNTFYKKSKKKELKSTDVERTIFKYMFNDLSLYSKLEYNPIIFEKLKKGFDDLNIKGLEVGNSLTKQQTIKDKLTICFRVTPNGDDKSQATGYFNRLKTFLFKNYKNKWETKEGVDIGTVYQFSPLLQEKIIKLELNNMFIGNYHKERNLIHLFFNPFILNDINIFDKEIPKIFSDIFDLLKEKEIKQIDTTNMREKMFITEFLKGTTNKISDIQQIIIDCQDNIKTYEKKLRTNIEMINTNHIQKEFLETLNKNNGKGLFVELKRTEKIPFIEELKFSGGEIELKFKPTFLPIPDMMRNDGGKRFGKRFIWIGSIRIKITPENFTVYGDLEKEKIRCHPHVSSSNSPCFGSGDGRNKIYELLSTNQFYKLTTMLWFWIKTYRNSGAYVKVWNMYDNILQNGLPVFDEKGRRIEINDAKRIEAGEQIKLTKTDKYETNHKKFLTLKLEK